MKRILLLSFSLLLLSGVGFAQSPDRCGTMGHLEWKSEQDPGYMQRFNSVEAAAQSWLQTHRSAVGGNVITIPTVVHIVYRDATQNLPDAQIFSQMDVLNADFRRMNADTLLTRPEFDSVASDFEVEFCLATTDPQGNPTTGITRTSTNGGQLLGWFGPQDDVKSSSTGGIDPWPTDQYLNIWVCDLLPILAGYAQFPGEDPATDGVVVGFSFFGTFGTVTPPFNKGRTTTHEIGHWLGLRHIWGDGDCSMDDFVDDTPIADAANQGGCLNLLNTCTDSPFDYNDQVENYMDYSNDSCMNMFSEGQKARAWSFLNTDRLSLFTSNGCSLAVSTTDPFPAQLFDLYPNPSRGSVKLEWHGGTGSEVDASIFDALGKVVWTKRLALESRQETLDLEGLAPGSYFIRIQSAEGVSSRRLMVQ